ncbi:MAG TPA: PASTA domain-containing protein, partial [Pyrinomonadaceae bacterium]
MSFGRRALSALGKVGIILAIALAFVFGLGATVYLSLRSSEVKVPDLIGKDRFTGESTLDDAGLSIRVSRTRPSLDKKPDTILNQWPSGGEIVKVGQTVAVEITRAPKEGENVPATVEEKKPEETPAAENSNANAAPPANANANGNGNKEKRNKNSNKNANANSNNGNANRNANNRNANANRNSNTGNRNANANTNNR